MANSSGPIKVSGSAGGTLFLDLTLAFLTGLGLFFTSALDVVLAGDCAQVETGTIQNNIAAKRPEKKRAVGVPMPIERNDLIMVQACLDGRWR